MPISTWNSDWFPLPGRAVFDRDRQRVAAVGRAPGHLDLFAIGFDNRVWSTFWHAATGWHADWFPLPGQDTFNRDTQHVTAVSRAPGNLDLFVIGFDNRVWSTFWTDLHGWNGNWFALPGHAQFDHRKQRIAAVARTSRHLDLFVVGFDKHCWTTYWNTAHGWNGDWFRLPGEATFDPNTQQVAAVARAPGNVDLFALGRDDRCWTTFWSDATGWNRDWFPLPGQQRFDHTTRHVTAVARTPGRLDLFALGPDLRCWSTFWSAAGDWSADWFQVPGMVLFDGHHQRVTAVSRAPGHLDLFVLGLDNQGWTTWWNDAHGWNREWFHVPGPTLFNHEAQHVAAVARTPSNLDLFVIGPDNHVWSTFWGQHAAHPAIKLRAVPGERRFVEVTGVGFTPNHTVKLGYDIVASGAPTDHQLGEDTLTCDAAGAFVDRIPVNLGGNINFAQAQAVDLASSAVAMASI